MIAVAVIQGHKPHKHQNVASTTAWSRIASSWLHIAVVRQRSCPKAKLCLSTAKAFHLRPHANDVPGHSSPCFMARIIPPCTRPPLLVKAVLLALLLHTNTQSNKHSPLPYNTSTLPRTELLLPPTLLPIPSTCAETPLRSRSTSRARRMTL